MRTRTSALRGTAVIGWPRDGTRCVGDRFSTDRTHGLDPQPTWAQRTGHPKTRRSRQLAVEAAWLDHVVRTHYTPSMKTAVIPQVRVEPELRADLDSVLLPGETLTEFVEASVRRAVEFRRVQADFAARCDASLATYERTGVSIPSEVVLSKLEEKVAARVKQLRK